MGDILEGKASNRSRIERYCPAKAQFGLFHLLGLAYTDTASSLGLSRQKPETVQVQVGFPSSDPTRVN